MRLVLADGPSPGPAPSPAELSLPLSGARGLSAPEMGSLWGVGRRSRPRDSGTASAPVLGLQTLVVTGSSSC